MSIVYSVKNKIYSKLNDPQKPISVPSPNQILVKMKNEKLVSEQEKETQIESEYILAFENLIKRDYKKFKHSLNQKTHSDQLSDDILQEASIKALKALREPGKYNEVGNMKSWFLRIVHNLFIDYIRNTKKIPTHRAYFISPTDCSSETELTISEKEPEKNFFDLPDDQLNKLDEIMNGELHNKVMTAISKLPKAQREVIFYRHMEGLSFKKIAEITGVSINTSLGRMRYALMNIRKALGLHRVLIKK
jgi:RNA polymerase sigma-70 factor (ECF subfamily)